MDEKKVKTANDILSELVEMRIRNTFKAALNAAEDILLPQTGPQLFKKFRSRVLTAGNDQIREHKKEYNQFDVQWARLVEVFLPPDKLGEESDGSG